MNFFKQNYYRVVLSWKRMIARDRRNRKTYRLYKRKLRQLCDDGQELERAKLLADARHATDGKTYYVLPDYMGALRAFNSAEIRELKKFGVMDKNVTVYDLLNEAKYCTAAQDRWLILVGSGYRWYSGTLENCIKDCKDKTSPTTNGMKIYAATPAAEVVHGTVKRNFV